MRIDRSFKDSQGAAPGLRRPQPVVIPYLQLHDDWRSGSSLSRSESQNSTDFGARRAMQLPTIHSSNSGKSGSWRMTY